MWPWPQTGQGWPTNGSGDDAVAGAEGMEEAGAALSVCFFAAGFLRVAVDFAAAVLFAGRFFGSSAVVMVT